MTDVSRASGKTRVAAFAGLLATAGLFAGLRAAFVFVREPFFDELFTLWFAARPYAVTWSTLQNDSSSLLHYGLVRLFALFRPLDLLAVRLLSLLCACLTAWLVLRSPQPPRVRAIALLLLAVFPAHVFFSSEARAYALVALLIGIATVCLHDWIVLQSRFALGAATLSMVLAAYAHAYGVLFFPLPVVLVLAMRESRRWKEAACSVAVAGLLFVPGFWLAAQQPPGALVWMQEAKPLTTLMLLKGPVGQLGFAAEFPYALLPPSPLALQLLSVTVMAVIVASAMRNGRGARIFGWILLTPCVLLLMFAIGGKTFYFPTRFESTLAVPLSLMIASTVDTWRPALRLVIVTVLCTLGILSSGVAIASHASRPEEPYRSAARFVRQSVPSNTSLIASSYAYLEVYSQQDAIWQVRLEAFPSSQGLHPGWWVNPAQSQLSSEADSLIRRRPDGFLWIGHRGSGEFRMLRSRLGFQPLFENQGATVGWFR
ncbi:MAG TPA: hypothetical protein VNM92_16025 [Thermoanaerobaculia bacterium]|nr:hypothetical protein [Thermoanaerobaculia bacterium]